MEQQFEKVSKRLGEAGPERDDTQPDEADRSEPHRGGGRWSTEMDGGKEKEQDGFQDRSKGHIEESPTSNSHHGHNSVSSHSNESFVEEPGQLPLLQSIENLEKQDINTIGPWPPRPEVGSILVAKHNFRARVSDELTLIKGDKVGLIEKDDSFGDGWFLGQNSSTGKSGLFPAIYTGVKAPRALASSEDSPTVQTEDGAWDRDPGADLRSKIVTWTGLKNSAGPVCGSCGARRDPGTGCSRSCDGTQDGLDAHRNMDGEYPEKSTSRMPARLISKRAVLDLGYTFIEEVKILLSSICGGETAKTLSGQYCCHIKDPRPRKHRRRAKIKRTL